jgi:hypothetical protein
MSKVTFNRLIDGVSGRMGNFIFYEADGQTLSRAVPKSTGRRSEKQKANSIRFLNAQRYAARALADPALKAAYKAACRGHQNPRNLAIRDALRGPAVESINLEGYTGKPSQIVRVKAVDDFRVVQVKVTVRGPAGELIEEGLAALTPDGGEWHYGTQVEVSAGQSLSITAVAQDTPGNTGLCQRWYYLAAATP